MLKVHFEVSEENGTYYIAVVANSQSLATGTKYLIKFNLFVCSRMRKSKGTAYKACHHLSSYLNVTEEKSKSKCVCVAMCTEASVCNQNVRMTQKPGVSKHYLMYKKATSGIMRENKVQKRCKPNV